MTPEAIYQALESHLGSQLALLNLTYLAQWEQFGGAVGAQSNPTPDQSWVRSNIQLGAVREVELGRSGAGLRSGVLLLQIFTPKGQVRQGGALAGTLEALLRRKNLAGVELGEPQSRHVENPTDNWEMHLLQVSLTAAT
ncbi:MAG: hypothetical protein RRB13_02675 [bacterium]|nr:hypothetical protein [bacterium]